jgi:uncharacterized membrane protein
VATTERSGFESDWVNDGAKVPDMKVLLIAIGSLAGIYALFAIIQFIGAIATNDPNSAFGTANIAASVVPVCLGLIVSVACFTAAFKKPKP